MIINSPVGRFPFSVDSVRIRRRRILLRGSMGTWPATVEATAADIPPVLARVSPGLILVLVAAAIVLVGVGVVLGALLF
ncbi:hypothetical protein [Leifsonia aquatica]|uniref:Uncharacterized protein n=2 Tax=Leifsonia aquatica TaxID=144185 RepID=U2T7Q8_LEIAQ|nr:hypothetical protein [Leifsonia aquatica]ERK73493.1 hypothetical protein N136_00051 [Leifsonia aquatica ATCC 14665]MBB2967942.1 hypothetical protein [Leifsonia aquatica]